ncbi:MAG: ABC transporter ATP-binding protein [Treponema sp.]|jgi:ABC-type Fe3+/spermidine/putrescine transport system ATPase subunit|nr:ABC transporter ATP-binding protein [Treponema sp.]
MSLEIRGLEKTFPGGFRLSIDRLEVAPGETLALAGPSGCGKTTALNIIAGFIREDRGEIFLAGENTAALPPWKRGISLVFQDLALFPHLSVGGNAAYGPFLRGIRSAGRRQIVAEALALVRLPGWEKRRLDTLSGGERQRVAIARALAARPRLLLLDEPFSSLDAPLRREIQGEFASIRANSLAPCVFVTHDREEAALLGDRIALMDRGRIVEIGTGRELFLEPKTAFAGRFFGRGTVLPAALLGIPAPEGRELFIPRDALRPLRGGGKSPGTLVLRAALLRSAIEGSRLNLELELPEGTAVAAEQSIRDPPPPQGKMIPWELDLSLVKAVE